MNRLVKTMVFLIAASLLPTLPLFGAATWVGGTPDYETDFNTASNWVGDPALETYFSISSASYVPALGAPSAWTPFDLYVGEYSDGQLDLTSGASLTAGYIAVGTGNGSGALNMTDAWLSTSAYSVIFGFGNAAATPTYPALVSVSGSSTVSAATAVLFGLQPEYSGGSACTATIGGSSAITANGSYTIDTVNVGILVSNGAHVSVSGSSNLAALAGTVMIRDNSVLTLDETSTLSSSASIGCHSGSILNVNSSGVIPGDPDGYTVKAPDLLAVGFNTENSTGVVNVTAGKVFGRDVWLGCWNGSLGSLNISGTGTFVTNAIAIGSIAGDGITGVGYVSVKGGTFRPDYAEDTVFLGVYGDGLLDISAGTMDCTSIGLDRRIGNAMYIGGVPGISGILNVRGTGEVINTTNVIRMRGNGIINVGVAGAPGGTLQTAAILPVPENDARYGTVNFHGGTITATVDADGVTIPEGGSTPNPVFIGNGSTDVAHVYVYSEGAKIDTNGHNVVIDCPLEAPAAGGVYGAVTGTPYTVPMTGNGSGYNSTPYVQVGGDGTGATAIALMSETNPDQVDHIQITNPGVGYANPTFTLVGGLGANGVAAAIDTTQVTTGANASGGLTKLGDGTLTLAGNLTYTGATDIRQGLLQIAYTADPVDLSGGIASSTGEGDLTVCDGVTLTTPSITVNTLTIGGGGRVPAPAPVPEPSTWILLAFALLGSAGGIWWKRGR
jgi:autotransporter-associated beta strand protein